jgi:ring-1,2-phenylacetyl-CoA epoxidase subunit PaaD
MSFASNPPPCEKVRSAKRSGAGVVTVALRRESPPRAASGHPSHKGQDKAAAQHRAWQAAAAVVDPEIPCVTVADLGILRAVEVDGDVAVAKVTPTYSGCPAVLAIELAVEAALRDAGFEARIQRVIAPAWTTDWITPQGREKLKAYGIAPPAKASNLIRALFGETEVECPRCGSKDTERLSEFGSTACKALYRCRACAEPFDYFKCI